MARNAPVDTVNSLVPRHSLFAMAGVFRGIFGQKEEPSPASSVEEPGMHQVTKPAMVYKRYHVLVLTFCCVNLDFADFDTETADPSPASIIPQYPDKAGSIPANPTGNVVGTGPYTYTKWYRIWERTSIDDFRNELYIIPILALIILSHVWGLRTNRRKAQGWFRVHAPILQQEFAVVGFGKRSLPLLKSGEEAQGEDGKQDYEVTDDFLKEKALNEFITYATGRLNVAALEVKMTLHKRYNPLLWFGDSVLGFFFESFPPPVERVQSVAFAFDGKEAKVVPTPGGNASKELAESRKRVGDSTYDGFVWAVVHKSCLRRLREERYDLSLTATRDHSKLPEWATIMTESAEITDRLLTSELIKAIEVAGDAFEAFIVSDQPLDQPKTYAISFYSLT